MTTERDRARQMEGTYVRATLPGRAHHTDALLVSVGRRQVPHVWLFFDGVDYFLPLEEFLDDVGGEIDISVRAQSVLHSDSA